MKTIRLWLLLVLAALLPIRGAMAAAMLCPPAGAGSQAEFRLHDHNHDHASHDHGREGHGAEEVAGANDKPSLHDHAGHGPAHGHQAAATHGTADTAPHADECHLCMAFCSITPLVSSLPVLPLPQELTAMAFPEICVPAPSFLSDGQDRPPRSA